MGLEAKSGTGRLDASYGKERCPWNVGDTVGCYVDIDARVMKFYANGESLGVAFDNFTISGGLYPAVSLNRNQSVRINFDACGNIAGASPVASAAVISGERDGDENYDGESAELESSKACFDLNCLFTRSHADNFASSADAVAQKRRHQRLASSPRAPLRTI